MDLSKAILADRSHQKDEIYLYRGINELYTKVEFFAKKGGALLVITGEPRSGKTSFAKYISEHLGIGEFETMFFSILSDEVKSGWLIPKVCKRLGITFEGSGLDLAGFISKQLEELCEEHKNLTIIVDGVEKLRTTSALDEIGFLSEIQTISDYKINFILLGESLILEKIKQTDLINKVTYFCQFPLLDKEEIFEYTQYKANEFKMGSVNIGDSAISSIEAISGGKISNVGLILDNCLLEAKLKGLSGIDADLVQKVVHSHLLMFKDRGMNLSAISNSKDNKKQIEELEEDDFDESVNQQRESSYEAKKRAYFHPEENSRFSGAGISGQAPSNHMVPEFNRQKLKKPIAPERTHSNQPKPEDDIMRKRPKVPTPKPSDDDAEAKLDDLFGKLDDVFDNDEESFDPKEKASFKQNRVSKDFDEEDSTFLNLLKKRKSK